MNMEWNAVIDTKNEAEMNRLAKLIAAVVEKQMTNFSSQHLTKAQSKELNPIIRDAIYTTLVQMNDRVELMNFHYIVYDKKTNGKDCQLVEL